jgi:DNA mismatch repair protein MutL
VNAPVEQTDISETTEGGGVDRIRLMPLALANKIAAGEVVQRPASAVKELIENALDAGATRIDVALQHAGSTLIQITDNGAGMSESDARMAVKRHATSKIHSIEDLECIMTLGFRGEALASIASVSQFEMRTGMDDEHPAFLLRLEGGEEVDAHPAPPLKGTSVSVRNLYFNVPARRNFLKRPQTELKHILDAVQVLSLAHPEVAFTIEHDGNMLLSVDAEAEDHTDATAARLSAVLPIGAPENLIRVEESTSYLAVNGFLGHPDMARRTRGLQFLFVNGRWVKNRYLEHAVHAAYEYLLPEGAYPFFALFLDIDSRHVDVNVHPTKSEVKFDDERGVYGMLRAVVGKALGTTLGSPDFSRAKPLSGLDLGFSPDSTPRTASDEHPGRGLPSAGNGPLQGGNPGLDALFSGATESRPLPSPDRVADASRSLYEAAQRTETLPAGSVGPAASKAASGLGEEGLLWQLHDTYILTQILSGLVIIDQQMAHERILYEQAKACLKDGFGLSQQLLFPRTIEFSASEYVLLEGLMPDLAKLGFDIEPFGGNSVIVRGVPADISAGDERSVLDEIVDQYRAFERVERLNGRQNLARSVARRGAVRAGIPLSAREMRSLIDQLFQCDSPYVSPDGRPTMIRMSGNELRERFDRK